MSRGGDWVRVDRAELRAAVGIARRVCGATSAWVLPGTATLADIEVHLGAQTRAIEATPRAAVLEVRSDPVSWALVLDGPRARAVFHASARPGRPAMSVLLACAGMTAAMRHAAIWVDLPRAVLERFVDGLGVLLPVTEPRARPISWPPIELVDPETASGELLVVAEADLRIEIQVRTRPDATDEERRLAALTVHFRVAALGQRLPSWDDDPRGVGRTGAVEGLI